MAGLGLIQSSGRHSDAQIDQIVASFLEFGVDQPVITNAQGVLIAGHGRLEAARQAGMTEYPVVVNDLSSLDATRRMIGDNRLAALAEPDTEVLGELLRQLQAEDALEGTGYDDETLETLLASLAEDKPPSSHKPSHGYDFRDIHAGKLAYRVEAAWRARDGVAVDLFSGQGQLAAWYTRRFGRVARVDKEAREDIEFPMKADAYLGGPFAAVAKDFAFIDFDDEGSPLREVKKLFDVLPGERVEPFVLCLTDGSGLNLKSRGRFDPGLYGLPGKLRQATRQDYDDFEELVTGAVERAAHLGGWTAHQWSSVRGSEGNVVYQTYLVTRSDTDVVPPGPGA